MARWGEESDGPAMTWIRASLARIHRTIDCVARLEAQADVSLTGILLHPFSLVTRRRRRVTGQIRRLAQVFVIAFARNHIAERPGFLLGSPSILRRTRVTGDATRP